MTSNISIYVAYHRNDVEMVSNSVYHPIHVGRAVSKVDLSRIIGDDTGDNISHLNPLYCETTATYWAWKNDVESDYIGICHYRRFFSVTNIALVKRVRRAVWYCYSRLKACFNPGLGSVAGSMFTNPPKAQFDALILDFEKRIGGLADRNSVDLFCLKPIKYAGQNVRSSFNILGTYQIELLERIVKDKYPHISPIMTSVLQSNKLSYANMVIMKRDIYNEYCSMLFDVLEQHRADIQTQGWCIDPMSEKCYGRMSGYLAELMTATFVEYMRQKKAKVYELTAINYGV